jgi:hypothetical protein
MWRNLQRILFLTVLYLIIQPGQADAASISNITYEEYKNNADGAPMIRVRFDYQFDSCEESSITAKGQWSWESEPAPGVGVGTNAKNDPSCTKSGSGSTSFYKYDNGKFGLTGVHFYVSTYGNPIKKIDYLPLNIPDFGTGGGETPPGGGENPDPDPPPGGGDGGGTNPPPGNGGGDGGNGGGDGGNGGGSCGACEVLTCPGWDNIADRIGEAVGDNLPPPPVWEEVAEVMADEIVPRMADAFEDVLENTLGRPDPPPPAPPFKIPVFNGATGKLQTEPTGWIDPAKKRGFDDVPEIPVSKDNTGGISLIGADPIESIPHQADGYMPEPGKESGGHKPQTKQTAPPIPNETVPPPATPPVPGSNTTAPPTPENEQSPPPRPEMPIPES